MNQRTLNIHGLSVLVWSIEGQHNTRNITAHQIVVSLSLSGNVAFSNFGFWKCIRSIINAYLWSYVSPQSLHFNQIAFMTNIWIKVFWVARFFFFQEKEARFQFCIMQRKNILKWSVLKGAAFPYHFIPTFSQVSYRHVEWEGEVGIARKQK